MLLMQDLCHVGIRSRFLQNHNHSHQIHRGICSHNEQEPQQKPREFQVDHDAAAADPIVCFVLVKDLRFLQGQTTYVASRSTYNEHVFTSSLRDRHRTQIHPLITTRSPDGTYHPFWAAVVIVDMEEDFARCRAGEESEPAYLPRTHETLSRAW